MPIDSEKNACAVALMMVSMVTREKSGVSKKASPGSAPGSVTERATSTSSSTNNSGINTLLARSMPLPTPPATIHAVRPMKIVAANSGLKVRPTKPLKWPPSTAGSAVGNWLPAMNTM